MRLVVGDISGVVGEPDALRATERVVYHDVIDGVVTATTSELDDQMLDVVRRALATTR